MRHSLRLSVAIAACLLGFVEPHSSRSPAVASELSYTCEVLHAYSLNDDGSLGPSGFESSLKGSRFTVSRLDGQILGEGLPTLLAQRTEVLSPGDQSNSFRAIAYFDSGSAGRDVQVTYVAEYRAGRAKPFVASSMGGAGIISGICD